LGNLQRFDAHIVPPGGFVAAVVEFAVMGPAERHGKIVADLAGHRPRLGEADMMGIGRRGAAKQARL
jgi:hypothetical protein